VNRHLNFRRETAKLWGVNAEILDVWSLRFRGKIELGTSLVITKGERSQLALASLLLQCLRSRSGPAGPG
jgi:hypothetical protein